MKLEQMEIFYFVALWHSFSSAARHLNLSKGYISKEISNLEKELKIKLFNRTTRYVGLTIEGEAFFNNCTKIVNEKNIALNQMRDFAGKPSGNLLISAPPSICENVLIELLTLFYKKYPEITLTIDSSAVVKNLSQYGIDIALRLTNDPDENYVARKIKNFRFIICATKNYFKTNGKPKTPENILQHSCLIYSNDPKSTEWKIGDKTIQINGIISTNNSIILKKYLLDDLGIAKVPNYMVEKELTQGKLERIFLKEECEELPLYAIYSSGRNIPLKIRYFLDFINHCLQ